MFKVLCTLDNASHKINGIAFETHPDGGVVSTEPVTAEIAEYFKAIPGYKIVAAAVEKVEEAIEGKKRGRPAKADLQEPAAADAAPATDKPAEAAAAADAK